MKPKSDLSDTEITRVREPRSEESAVHPPRPVGVPPRPTPSTAPPAAASAIERIASASAHRDAATATGAEELAPRCTSATSVIECATPVATVAPTSQLTDRELTTVLVERGEPGGRTAEARAFQ